MDVDEFREVRVQRLACFIGCVAALVAEHARTLCLVVSMSFTPSRPITCTMDPKGDLPHYAVREMANFMRPLLRDDREATVPNWRPKRIIGKELLSEVWGGCAGDRCRAAVWSPELCRMSCPSRGSTNSRRTLHALPLNTCTSTEGAVDWLQL